VTKVLIFLPYTWPTISTRFFKSFLELVRYPIHDVEVDVHISNTFPLDRNRNQAALIATNTYKADYVLFVDGDNILPKNALEKLLEHASNEFPVVSGLYFRKTRGCRAVPGHYAPWGNRESIRKTIESIGFVDNDGNQLAFYNPVLDFDTIQPIDVSGCGCLLIRTDVFYRLELPYFGYFNAESLGGDYSLDHMSEEMLFFAKLRKAGIKTLLVPQIRCGHLVEKVVGGAEEP
jgi:glycosyltransferase involved in cell wall biosynthesis